MKEAAGKVAELSFDIGMIRRALIAWEKEVVTQSPSAEQILRGSKTVTS
jgi:hypothetical protein